AIFRPRLLRPQIRPGSNIIKTHLHPIQPDLLCQIQRVKLLPLPNRPVARPDLEAPFVVIGKRTHRRPEYQTRRRTRHHLPPCWILKHAQSISLSPRAKKWRAHAVGRPFFTRSTAGTSAAAQLPRPSSSLFISFDEASTLPPPSPAPSPPARAPCTAQTPSPWRTCRLAVG